MSGLHLFESSGAVLSPCGAYRYTLWRSWGDGGRVNFVMLNPSTADASEDDPTIRRCIGFAREWGYGSLVVTNVFALRSTDPRVLKGHADPIGPDNDRHITEVAFGADRIVCAWGAHGGERARHVAQMLAAYEPDCLGTTKDGSPRHPLYLRKDTRPTRLSPLPDSAPEPREEQR